MKTSNMSGRFTRLFVTITVVALCHNSQPAAAQVARDNPGDPPNAGSPVGINLGSVTYWGSSWVFTDAFRKAAPWIPQRVSGGNWNTGIPLALDQDGWPILKTGEAAGTLLFRGHAQYPKGDYLLEYDGDGDILVGFDAKVVRSQRGSILFRVNNPSTNGIYLKLVRSDATNRVRNIRVWMPGYHSGKRPTFHPTLLRRLAPFRVLRFMDWMRTNGSKVRRWEDRATPAYYTQADARGVAPELMVELCNELHADAWLCMPHLADDRYVLEFARLVKARLDPRLRVWIEHSNEVWNGQFPQARFAADEGQRLKLSTNRFQGQLYYHSKRSVEMFEIWRSAFGGTTRLVRVLGAQAANPWTGKQVAEFQQAWKKSDALATAPYFGGELGSRRAGEVVKWTVGRVLDECEALILQGSQRRVEYRKLATGFGLDLVAYEGGQHLVGVGSWQNNQTLTDLFVAANRQARMRDLYHLDLDSWVSDGGGGMFVAFSSIATPGRYGSWGVVEYELQTLDATPKYRALLEHIDERKPVVHYGTGCGGIRVGHIGLPALGNTGFRLVAAPAARAQTVLFFLGTSRDRDGSRKLPFDLSAFGLSGCWQNASSELLLATTPSAALWELPLPVPSSSSLVGLVLYGQALAFDPNNRNTLVTSEGLRVRVIR